MSGQKPLHFLRSTKYWSLVQQFLDDQSQETLSLPTSVTAADRDLVRQICKHFDVPFKVHGEGTEKFMMLRKPDYSYLEQAEEEQRKALTRDQQELRRLQALVLQLSNNVITPTPLSGTNLPLPSTPTPGSQVLQPPSTSIPCSKGTPTPRNSSQPVPSRHSDACPCPCLEAQRQSVQV